MQRYCHVEQRVLLFAQAHATAFALFALWAISLFNGLVQEVRRPIVYVVVGIIALFFIAVGVLHNLSPSEPIYPVFELPSTGKCVYHDSVRSHQAVIA